MTTHTSLQGSYNFYYCRLLYIPFNDTLAYKAHIISTNVDKASGDFYEHAYKAHIISTIVDRNMLKKQVTGLQGSYSSYHKAPPF